MKKSMQIMVLFLLLLTLTLGCSSNASTQPSISPQGSPTPNQSTSPKPEEQAKVFTLAGKAADIMVDNKKIAGNAYYTDTDKEDILIPLTEVSKALGWAVTEPETVGPIEIKMTKQDADEIIISFTRPERDTVTNIGDIQVMKGGKPTTINEMDSVPFIDGMLYVTEEFMSQAVEKIAVKYNGETLITVTPSA